MSANCAPSQVEMDSATPTMNPSPKSSRNVYHIGGIPVEFPYKPYGSQLAFMGRVISTLDRAQRQGHCHALLESPTGTGKSLSLLCSALAWQQNHRSKHLHADLSHSKPAPEAFSDPLAYGGGFVPEPEPSGNSVSGALNSAPALTNKAQKKKTVPVIFYASRTHSQISQVVREYRKTSYRVRMAVLASRKHYCTNAHLCGKENIDEECKLLLKAPDIGCPEFKNAHKVKAHPSLEKGGCHEVHDIEDLVKIGRAVKGCSYFAARSLAEDADLVFCPYSYIISPTIRRAMEIDLKGAILILDEAHNIEDMARDAGSVDVEEDVLFALQTELGQLCLADALVYQPLYEMIQGIISWIGENKNKLEKREFQHHFSCWTGEKALRALQEAGISRQCFSILQECATKAIKATSEAESGGFYLTGTSAMSLEGLFSSFTYFFSGNGLHIHDYQLSLQRYVKRDARHAIGGWTLCFSLWCLNPAVVFRDIADLSMSVVLTSGTLAPMNSFSSELGVQFETCMEAPHVIDVESQLWAAVISNGPGNYPLNASYKTADGYAFQDALGASLEEICKIVPGGALVFFPSYKLMEKLCSRWQETDQWSRLNAQKSLFVEPRGSQDDFNLVLKSYYDSVSHGGRPVFGRNRKGKRRGLNNRISGTKSPQNPVKVGAAFLAVCRGKVSEGIDFSDENARVVIIVGIPFPNINDIQVALKKKYNDTYKSSKNLLSGNEWYCQQAFRALNQAAGRCIRHKFDYGAIIFIDERYREERNMAYVSKWLRKSIKKYDSFDTSLDGLKNFFQDVKEWVGQKGKTLLEASDISDENIPSTRQKQSGKASFGKKMQTVHQLDDCDRQELVSKDNKKGVYSSQYINSICENKTAALNQKAHGTVDVNQFSQTGEKDMEGCRDYIDLECSFEKDSRCLETFSVASSSDSQEISVVKETPVLGDDVAIASPEVSDKDDNSNSTIIQASKEITPEVSYKDDNSITCGPPNDTFSLAITPEKRASLDICNQKSEMCSYLNLSVNSHTQKRRKQIGLPLVDLVQLDGFGNPDEKPAYLDSKNSINGPTDANRRIEFGFKESYSECQYKNLNDLEYLKSNNCSTSCASSILVMDKRLCIRCSLCRNMLGLSENHFLVTCLLTTSSKTYLTSLLGSDLESPSTNRLKGVPVVISDISSVDPRVYKKTAIENGREQDIWCEEDGCVFRTVFCPFCTASDKCLGLQIMACNSPNVHLLDKILFYFDCLEINNLEGPKAKDSLRGNGANVAELNSINKFSYLPQSQSSRGWRTTKSKLRRPKRGILSETEDQKNAEAGAPVDT